MEKILIKNEDNQSIEVDLVRYFKYKNTNYLIYTKHEKDEKGYIKLYLVKIMKQFNEWIAKTIKDDIEWKKMQSIVQQILKELKSSKISSFQDLDVSSISNVKIKEARYFKLDEKLVKMLTLDSANEATDNQLLENLPSMNELSPVQIEKSENLKNSENAEVDYKKLYEELKKDNEELNETMADMLVELSEYRAKYGKIEEQ